MWVVALFPEGDCLEECQMGWLICLFNNRLVKTGNIRYEVTQE